MTAPARLPSSLLFGFLDTPVMARAQRDVPLKSSRACGALFADDVWVTAKRSSSSTLRGRSPGFVVLREEARPAPISWQCQQTSC